MARKWSIDSRYAAPSVCAFLVLVSMLHPGQIRREMRACVARCDGVLKDNALLREQLAACIAFLNSYTPHLAGASDDGAVGDAGPSSVAVGADVSGASYMVARGNSGIRIGNDYWLVGDVSPWGVIESAYRGGFVADGVRHRTISTEAKANEQ